MPQCSQTRAGGHSGGDTLEHLSKEIAGDVFKLSLASRPYTRGCMVTFQLICASQKDRGGGGIYGLENFLKADVKSYSILVDTKFENKHLFIY